MSGPLLKDARWVRQSFLVRAADLDAVDAQNRTFSTVSLKFVDTTPGGNFAINPPPQFTRFADLRNPGRFSENYHGPKGARGMGRYYSEAIDDHAQVIHMRFGVPQFSSMTQFFTGFYNSGAGQIAKTGRANSAFYYLGRAAGFVVSVMSWKILAVHMLGVIGRFALENTSSKFYYMKPAMPLYWNAVTTMVNQLAVNRGIIPRVGEGLADKMAGNVSSKHQQIIEQMHEMLPDVFKKNGGIDVYAMANRAQRLARKQYRRMEQAMTSLPDVISEEDLTQRLQKIQQEILDDAYKPKFNSDDPKKPDPNSYLEKWFTSQSSKPKDSGSTNTIGVEEAVSPSTADDGLFNFFAAELDDGGAYASFRVNYTGAVGESFSNQVGESELASKINSMSSSARSTQFSLSGGNISNNAVMQMVQGAANAVKDFAQGALDQVGLSGIAALAGSAFVDIPKHWQSSIANMPRANYTIRLVSPYGNPISQLVNIYIPLSMLLAAALPMATGRASYTSPFLVELFDRGRCQIRMGMVDSLSITRGTGNLGFNTEGNAMAVDVSFSVVDLSSIMTMPVSQGFTLGTGTAVGVILGGTAGAVAGSAAGPAGTVVGGAAGAAGGAAAGAAVDAAVDAFNGLFANDNAFSDYMAVIAGMGVADQIYQFRKFRLNLTRTLAQWDSFTSASRMASFARDTLPAHLLSSIYKGTWRDGPNLNQNLPLPERR